MNIGPAVQRLCAPNTDQDWIARLLLPAQAGRPTVGEAHALRPIRIIGAFYATASPNRNTAGRAWPSAAPAGASVPRSMNSPASQSIAGRLGGLSWSRLTT